MEITGNLKLPKFINEINSRIGISTQSEKSLKLNSFSRIVPIIQNPPFIETKNRDKSKKLLSLTNFSMKNLINKILLEK